MTVGVRPPAADPSTETAPPGPRSLTSVRRLVPPSLAVLLLLVALFYLLQAHFTMDDAAISFAYARQWAHGHGLGVLVTGGPRVEGYSDFLWVALLAAAVKLGVSALTAAKILALAASLGTAALLHDLLRRHLRRPALLWGLVLLPVSLSWTLWSASGLENGLYSFLLVLSAWLLLRDRPRWSALALLAVALTRPDGIAFAAVGLGLLFARRRNGAGAAAIFTLGYGAYLAWHYHHFATWLPNTSYAKLGQPGLGTVVKNTVNPASPGWAYVAGYAWHHGALLLVPGVIAGVVCRGSARAVLALFLGAALLLPLYQPDWMVHYRFLSDVAPFAVALALLGLDRVSGRAVAAVVAVGLCGYGVFGTALSLRIHQRGYEGYVSMEEVHAFYSPLRDDARRLGLHDPLYFLGDLGATTDRLDMRVLDSIGLSDYAIAHSGWNPRLLEQYVFGEQRPAFVSTYGKWTARYHLTQMPELARDYVRIPFHGGPPGYMRFVRKDSFVSSLPAGASGAGLQVRSVSGALDVVWSAGPGAPLDAMQHVRMLDRAGRVVLSRDDVLGYGWYPVGAWKPGEAIRQHLELPPTVGSGEYTLEVSADGVAPYRQTLFVQTQIGHGSAASPSASLEPQLLDQARADLAAHDDDAVLAVALRAAALRGRHDPSEAWEAFAGQLRHLADRAAGGGRAADAYTLYRAAWVTNPTDVWAQRSLERARRQVVLGR